MNFPLYKTKDKKISAHINLNSPTNKHRYFKAKAGKKIEKIKEYLDTNTFVGFLIAKKAAGKGTYSRIFRELVGENRVELISVGDLVRDIHAKVQKDQNEKDSLMKYLSEHYRGFLSKEEAMDAFLEKSQEKLIPTEFILSLIRKKIDQTPDKAIFIDGFPRKMDQISYSLYFRQIMNLRDDPDFFVFIDVPEAVIDARIKTRVVCPLCHTARNIKLHPSQFVVLDDKTGRAAFLCDNKSCVGYKTEKMLRKEGDEAGIESIRERLTIDGELIKLGLTLHGVEKVLLRNAIPITEAKKFDNYEITPEYYYEINDKTQKVEMKEKPWTFLDDNGVESYSLLSEAVVLSMIDQIYRILCK